MSQGPQREDDDVPPGTLTGSEVSQHTRGRKNSCETLTPAAAFRAVFEEHLPYVLATLRRLGASEKDVDDLAQEVFLVVYRRLGELDLERSLRAYLFRVMHNIVRGHRRRAIEQASRSAVDVDDDRHGKTDPNVRALLAQSVVYRALESLDENARAVFVLIDMEHRSAEQAADILGVSVRTVYSRLKAGRDAFTRAARSIMGEVEP